MKKLIPAIALLLISAVVMSTASYAWFSMNTQVTASGMTVQAKAEGGIVISNSSKTTWSATATAQNTSATLFPTSKSATGTNWYHNKSTDANDSAAGQVSATYATLTTALSATSEGIGYVESGANTGYQAAEDASYFLLNNFTIKSSGDALTGTTLKINSVSVASSATLLTIDASLRVAIVVGSQTYIYAPVATPGTPTYTYKVGGDTNDTVCYNPTEATAGGTGAGAYLAGKNLATSVTSIPNTDTGVAVQIYVYFEGEDSNCKSVNVSGITLDQVTVSVVFGTTDVA